MSFPVMSEAAAGFSAGVIGTLVGFPLDTVKTTMQSQASSSSSSSSSTPTMMNTFRHIYRKDGLRGYFRGVASPLLALTILNTLNFSSYATFRSVLVGEEHKEKKPASFQPVFFLAGAMAGPLASCISTPFELVKIQMQISKRYKNSVEASYQICKQNGISALFRGHAVNTTREMIFLGTYFFVYEHSRGVCASLLPVSLAIPISGGISGAIGWFISFPLDCIKANIQGSDLSVPKTSANKAVNVARSILDAKGVWGLYSGIVPSISRAFLVSASRFTVYEYVYWIMIGPGNKTSTLTSR